MAENEIFRFPEDILRTCVRQMYPKIVASFDPRDYILDSLFARGTITADEKQQIEITQERKSAALVDLLYSCQRPNAFTQFLEIISDDERTFCKWISDEIQQVAQEKVKSTPPPSLENKKSSGPMRTTAADDGYDDILRQCLQQMYSTIVARFDPKGYILDSLFAKGTISIHEKQRLERLPDRRSAELVSVLLESRPNAISQFLEILSISNEPAWERISEDVYRVAKEELASAHKPSLESGRRLDPMIEGIVIPQSSQIDNGQHSFLILTAAIFCCLPI